MHVIHLMANNSSVPYFKWFAERSAGEENIKMSFIAMYRERPRMLDDMEERNCDCYWVPFDDAKRKRDMLKAVFTLYKLFRKIKPDVVHTHLFDDSLPGLLAAKLAGVKVRVITKQDTTFHWYYQPAYIRFDRWNNRIATHIHAVATENRKFILEKEKAKPEKVHLIRNGFPYDIMTKSDDATIAKLKKKFGLEGRYVIGTVARLIAWKGHDLIVKAAAELVRTYPDLKFIWAGTGDENYIKELREQIKTNNLEDHILLLDWVDREDMPSLYKCMDLYLHPALREPFGFAISEALMNQVPVAATPTGSVDLIQHKHDGYLLEQENWEDIIEAVRFYYSYSARTKEIAAKGHQHALDNLLFENMWQGHIDLYQSALKKVGKA